MSSDKQREIASKGGRAAHQKGTAHEWSSDEAREAGRKGGMASRGGRGKLPVDIASESASRSSERSSTIRRRNRQRNEARDVLVPAVLFLLS